MNISNIIVQVCEELQPQASKISVGVNARDRSVIEVKFLPKRKGPITITIPEGVRITLETMPPQICDTKD